jgi:RIO kinase 1
MCQPINGKLLPESPLTGRFEQNEKPADLVSMMREINDTHKEEARQLFQQ